MHGIASVFNLFLITLVVCATVVHTTLVYAAEIEVMGLFSSRALLKINGEQKFLKQGETFNGVTLINATPEVAVVEIDGAKQSLKMGRWSSMQDTTAVAPRRTQIARDQTGHYFTTISINHQPISALIDTGATTMAMNQRTAERLGIQYRVQGKKIQVGTASGTANAWKVVLNSVKIGEIERRNIEAAIIEGNAPTDVLVGMSYLRTVRLRDENNVLYLESTY